MSAKEEVRAGRYVLEGVRRERQMQKMLEKYQAEMLGSKAVLLTGNFGMFPLSKIGQGSGGQTHRVY